jgi:dipeptidase E
LLALSPEVARERIMAHDVIYVLGGPTDYEMYTLTKSGFIDMLPGLLESKVYVGSSAGSMILGRRMSTEIHAQIFGRETDKDDTFGITKYLELVDFAIFPHMDSVKFPNCTPENLKQVAPQLGTTVYGLADEAAIIVDGDQVSVVGDDYIRI